MYKYINLSTQLSN